MDEDVSVVGLEGQYVFLIEKLHDIPSLFDNFSISLIYSTDLLIFCAPYEQFGTSYAVAHSFDYSFILYYFKINQIRSNYDGTERNYHGSESPCRQTG